MLPDLLSSSSVFPAKAHPGCPQLRPEVRILLEGKEQAVLVFWETIQVKIRRLEHLLHLKDVQIDGLTRCLQQAEQR
ncbi:sperm flagellar protein 1-like [Mobula hypostoma]|uniref:sperm flagellar protein 1-like n=1 Tax=Mobula hypostoma TaxID=723540 RepID=UPI002FC3A499